jgi:hypothetical protein
MCKDWREIWDVHPGHSKKVQAPVCFSPVTFLAIAASFLRHTASGSCILFFETTNTFTISPCSLTKIKSIYIAACCVSRL